MTKTLAIHGGAKTIEENKARFVWPKITKDVEKAILKQLHTAISIYDRSGVFEEFEDAFAKYHNCKYGLLFNSGTSAIFAMFEAIGLGPKDELLCPVYTFHATVSPLTYIGATPIFCDSDAYGGVSLEEIKKRRTTKTRAVIVTHMWGQPVRDIEKIANYCRKEKLFLLEDCSHAHGASIYGTKVGSFGDIAAWSLQGQKIVTGGEGGILLTNNKKFYERALIQGHYNKRPRQEIAPNDVLRDYSLTGLGLKLRAHPIAIAMAYQQFRQLDKFISWKQTYAEMIIKAFSKYKFIQLPLTKDIQNSWYALPFCYDEGKAFGISCEKFVEALIAEGLVEFDIPSSTGLLNKLPLFVKPHELLPQHYAKKS